MMYPNILMVEDDRTMRIVIKSILLRVGFVADQIYEAVNGKEGLEILRQYDIDLILTDINMPVMDGLEMLGHIRSHPDFTEVPTIVITSRRGEKLVNTITKSGMGFIHKPFTWQTLKKKIISFIGERNEDLAQTKNL